MNGGSFLLKNPGPTLAYAHTHFIYTQLEVPLDAVALALDKAKACGATTILDPAPALLLPASLLSHVDILTPNENEACLLLGETPHRLNAEEASGFAHRLQQLGPRSVIITLGDHGVCVREGDGNTQVLPAVPVPIVDTTAAGDIFNGALVVALCLNQQLPDAVAFANHAAALSTTKRGAQTSTPSRAELEQFILAR